MHHVPKLCKHRASGQYFVRLSGKRHYLGTAVAPARSRYAKLINEWETAGRSPGFDSPELATVSALIADYMRHCAEYYRRADGTVGSEADVIALAVRPLQRLYGDEAVAAIDALKIEAARNACIDHRWMTADDVKDYDRCRRPRGWCRRTINQNLGRWKRMFRWGFTRKMVSLETLEQVRAVEGLRAGRSNARETKEVMPVAPAIVESTLPHVAPTIRAMIELQRLSGMRPGEVVRLRPCDIDRTGDRLKEELGGTPIDLGDAWVYLPRDHKTAYLGHRRFVPIGPQAQAVLQPWLDRPAESFCFSPAESVAIHRAKLRERRQSPVQPSQVDRRKAKPRKVPSESYTTSAYAHAISVACRENGIRHWHPHQLRHDCAHRIENAFDYETARQVLGHRHVDTTKLYLRGNLERALRAMEKAG